MRTDARGNGVFVRDSVWCNLSLDPIRMLHVVVTSVTALVEKNTLPQLALSLTPVSLRDTLENMYTMLWRIERILKLVKLMLLATFGPIFIF